MRTFIFRRAWVLHPILFALFPVMQLYGQNAAEIPFSDTIRALLLALLISAGLMTLFSVLLRDRHRAGLVVTLMVLLFFSFRHVLYLLSRKLHLPVGANILMAVWAAGFILSVWALIRKVRSVSGGTTQVLNAAGAGALLLAFLPLPVLAWNNLINPVSELAAWDAPVPVQAAAAVKPAPDIYYIVLDGFAREDVLRELYGIENPALVGYLKQRGFQVAEDSHANYMITIQSITSGLNYQYLPEMLDIDPGASSELPLERLLDNNRAAAFLKERGYTFVMVTTGYKATRVETADVLVEAGKAETFNSFEASLLFNSMLAPWMDTITAPMHRTKNVEAMRQVAQQARRPGPKFVFAHIMIPHPPFLFDAEGNPVLNSSVNGREGHAAGEADIPEGNRGFSTWREAYADGYRQQVIYTSRLAQQMVEQILADSPTPPVIIVQGDHGPDSYVDWYHVEASCPRERFAILNALYLPELAGEQVPADLTPVNTFRWVFNHYFGAQFPMEENHSYAFILPSFYNWADMNDKLDSCPAIEEEVR